MSETLDKWKQDFLTYTDAAHTDSTKALNQGNAYLALLQSGSKDEKAIQTTQDLLKNIQEADAFVSEHPLLIQEVLTLSDKNMKRVNAAVQVKWDEYKVELAKKAVDKANEAVQSAAIKRDEAQTTYKLAQEKTQKEQDLYDAAMLSYQEWLKAMEEINARIEV
jgi:ABC-type nitrate/sulfonate/bicarbonate transport system substrate-binding protein